MINIASVASCRGWSNACLYLLSKFGVVSLTETLACEWAKRGCPRQRNRARLLHDLNKERMAQSRKELGIARTPMARFGELDELVGAAIFLASPAAKYVTGETIRVDGGYLAMGI